MLIYLYESYTINISVPYNPLHLTQSVAFSVTMSQTVQI